MRAGVKGVTESSAAYRQRLAREQRAHATRLDALRARLRRGNTAEALARGLVLEDAATLARAIEREQAALAATDAELAALASRPVYAGRYAELWRRLQTSLLPAANTGRAARLVRALSALSERAPGLSLEAAWAALEREPAYSSLTRSELALPLAAGETETSWFERMLAAVLEAELPPAAAAAVRGLTAPATPLRDRRLDAELTARARASREQWLHARAAEPGFVRALSTWIVASARRVVEAIVLDRPSRFDDYVPPPPPPPVQYAELEAHLRARLLPPDGAGADNYAGNVMLAYSQLRAAAARGDDPAEFYRRNERLLGEALALTPDDVALELAPLPRTSAAERALASRRWRSSAGAALRTSSTRAGCDSGGAA